MIKIIPLRLHKPWKSVPYVNAENINFVRSLTKYLIGAVKSNLEIALSAQARAHGKFVKIREVDLKIGVP